MESLKSMRNAAGPHQTVGLSDDLIQKFLLKSPELNEAIEMAFAVWKDLDPQMSYKQNEVDLIKQTKEGWCLFYKESYRVPFVPIAAKGSWIITLHGAVVNDSGGYGMLGFGHAPTKVLAAMSRKELVMANVMTPSLSHIRFQKAIRSEIGRTRSNGCPFKEFLFMNSGSEANAVVDRIVDTASGHNESTGKALTVSLLQSFHGRTFKPAVWTHSSTEAYLKARCRSLNQTKAETLVTVEANDCKGLVEVFEAAEKAGNFIELVVFEAVMGEGNPGERITPEFYSLARDLTIKTGSFLAIDSVQAGFRTHGYLSIVDYPGFSDLPAPDFEAFSKALNAGQYPLSVLALSERAAGWHKVGVYGNTMTGNPRACEVAVAVLEGMADGRLRTNIRETGSHAVLKFEALKRKFPSAIEKVTGTGLLYAVHMYSKFPVTEDFVRDGISYPCSEKWMRMNGIGVIHGGSNALRFTPPFAFTKDEVDLQVEMLAKYLEIVTRTEADQHAPIAVEVEKVVH